MIPYFRLFLLLLFLTIMAPGFGQASELPVVLGRLVESYGGEDNLRKLDNMKQQWHMVAMIRNQNGTDIRHVKAPDLLRVELSYPDKKETRIITPETAHVIFKDAEPKAVTGMQRDAMRLQQMRLYSPLMLKNKIESMDLIEEGDHLALSLVEGGLHVYYMVNKETWRIEKVAGTLMMHGNEIKFLTIYSDFTMKEGVLIHQKEDKYAGGVNTAMLKLKEITLDAEFPDSLFQP